MSNQSQILTRALVRARIILWPRAITIGDWKKLADTGDFDSNYLHLHAMEPSLA